ncbi:unnamed protein product [Chrysoparadoxa australica]
MAGQPQGPPPLPPSFLGSQPALHQAPGVIPAPHYVPAQALPQAYQQAAPPGPTHPNGAARAHPPYEQHRQQDLNAQPGAVASACIATSEEEWWQCGIHQGPSSELDIKIDSQLRSTTACFIMDAGLKLSLSVDAAATAVTFCQRFFAVQSFEQHDRFLIATTCLFLAAKVEECSCKLEDVLMQCHELWNAHKMERALERKSTAFRRLREKLLICERAVMQTISFCLMVDHVHRHIPDLIKALRPVFRSQHGRELTRLASAIANDCLGTRLCLTTVPRKLAAAIVFTAATVLDKPVALKIKAADFLELTDDELHEQVGGIMAMYEAAAKDDSRSPSAPLSGMHALPGASQGFSHPRTKPLSGMPPL